MIQKALDFLKSHIEVAFATCEGNRPRIRVFQIMKQEGTTLYFRCTSSCTRILTSRLWPAPTTYP